MSGGSWTLRLTASAEADFEAILHWTAERFGTRQARIYAETLIAALASLADGPDAEGARARHDIGAGLFTLHVARRRRRGRHVILFRLARQAERPAVEVLRLLHDAMDLPAQAPPESDRKG